MLGGLDVPTSPASEILTNNRVPTSIEAQEIHDILSQVDNTIARIEAELTRLTLARNNLLHLHGQNKSGAISRAMRPKRNTCRNHEALRNGL